METRTYIVTIRMLEKNPAHDPRDKKSGMCPVSGWCTDTTGEHHSFLLTDVSGEMEARKLVYELGEAGGYRLTRLEEVR